MVLIERLSDEYIPVDVRDVWPNSTTETRLDCHLVSQPRSGIAANPGDRWSRIWSTVARSEDESNRYQR